MKRWIVFWEGEYPGTNRQCIALHESSRKPSRRMQYDRGLIYLYDRVTGATTVYQHARRAF